MRMQHGKRAFTVGLPAAMVLALAGCGHSAQVGETHVGKGELFKTGVFNYDEFFDDVYAYQGNGKHAADDEKAARAPLGQNLGIGETSIERLLTGLKDKADELARGKSRVHLTMEGLDDDQKPAAGKQITVTAAAKGHPVPKEATELAASLEQTARAEGQVWEKYGPMTEKGHHLTERAESLNGSAAADFASSGKRDEVYRELKAAKTIVTDISSQCGDVAANATKFLKESNAIVIAAANVEIKAPSKPAKGKPGKAAPPSGKPTQPPGVKPKPAEAAKPAPKAAESPGDFNP